MEIKRNGSQPSTQGTGEYFTGTVRIDPLFQAPDPARVAGASVTFEPGARTAWHTHPLGQTLIVTVRSAAGRSARADRSRKSGRATWSGFRPARSIGTAHADHRDDAHRHPGKPRRQDRRLDGEGQRRTISGLARPKKSKVQRTTGVQRCKSANLERATWKSRPSGSAAWE